MRKIGGTKLLPVLATAVIAVLLSSACIQAAVYDVSADFSTLDNPNGTWSYGYCNPAVGPSGFTTFNHTTPLPGSPDGTVVGWCAAAGGTGWTDPNINKNTSSDTTLDLYGITWAPQQVALGGLYSWVAQIRWTCPEDGLYQVESLFSGLQTGGATANWLISKNTSFDWLMAQMGAGYGSYASYSGQVALLAGDTLDFLSHGQQHTGISATISTSSADSNQWAGNLNGHWNSTMPEEWTSWSVPQYSGDVARFSYKIAGDTTVTVDQPVTVGTLSFFSSHSYTLVGAESITLDNIAMGANATIEVRGTHTISTPIVLSSALDITFNGSTDSLTLDGTVSEGAFPGEITVSGGGTLSIPTIPASMYALNLSGATLRYTGATATPARPINATSGTSKIDVENSATVLTLGDNFTGGAAGITKTGLGTLKIEKTYAGTYPLAGSFAVQAGNVEFNGPTDSASTVTTLNVAAESNGAVATMTMAGGAQLLMSGMAEIGCNGGSGTLDMGGTSDTEFSILSIGDATWCGVDNVGAVAQATVNLDGYAELRTAAVTDSNANLHFGWGVGSSATATLSGHSKLVFGGTCVGVNTGLVDIGDAGSTASITLQDYASFTLANGYLIVGGNVQGEETNGAQGTLTLKGSATFTTGRTVEIGDSGSTGILNLSGGVFTAPALVTGATGTGTINFDGGTLQATTGTLTYFDGWYEQTATGADDFIQGTGVTVNIKAGGAKIDIPLDMNVTITQELKHVADGLDGGVTKLGEGQLTLSGTLSYTGDTTVAQGTLNLTTALDTPDATVTVLDGTTLSAVSIVADTLVIGGTLPTPNVAAVPEPGTAVLLIAVAAGLLAVIRRSK
jgi:autotransporter-associated beta strand protein